MWELRVAREVRRESEVHHREAVALARQLLPGLEGVHEIAARRGEASLGREVQLSG
jgi:hypothetical protein